MTATLYLDRDGIVQYVPADKLAQLTDDAAGQVIDWDVVDSILKSATERINGYFRQRYTLPFVQGCDDLREWAGAIARHALYLRRTEGGADLPPAIMRAYDEALRCLREVRDNKLTLDVIDSRSARPDLPHGPARKTRTATVPKDFGTNEWKAY